MKAEAQKDVHRIFLEEGKSIEDALKQGVREAIVEHKRDGLPMVVERDGKIEWVKPENLPNT